MKMICTHPCQFRGVLVQADTVLDISDAEAKANAQVESSFRALEGDAGKSEDKPDDRGMTAQNYRDRLMAMNLPFHPTDGIDELRKLFDRATDQSARKRAK